MPELFNIKSISIESFSFRIPIIPPAIPEIKAYKDNELIEIFSTGVKQRPTNAPNIAPIIKPTIGTGRLVDDVNSGIL